MNSTDVHSMSPNGKIPLIVYFTESHRLYFDRYFLPSFQRHLGDDFYLCQASGPQDCVVAEYLSPAWHAVTSAKLRHVRRTMDALPAESLLFYSDVDVMFTASPKQALLNELGDGEIALQDDCHALCTGLFIARNTPNVRALLDAAIADCHDDDQLALNRVIERSSVVRVRLSEKFYSVWRSVGPMIWRGALVKWPEQKPVAFHANFAVGLTMKCLLLDSFIAHYEGTFFSRLRVRVRGIIFLLLWKAKRLLQRIRGRA